MNIILNGIRLRVKEFAKIFFASLKSFDYIKEERIYCAYLKYLVIYYKNCKQKNKQTIVL